jgi:hypothetical protein
LRVLWFLQRQSRIFWIHPSIYLRILILPFTGPFTNLVGH